MSMDDARAPATAQVIADRYAITSFIGAGGFAEVYAGRDEVLGREVAIKLLRLERLESAPGGAERMLERFKREARVAARINHTNVVTIYDYGIFEGRPYMVMERLYGRDLNEELKRHGPMAPARLWPLFCRALDGLATAHQEKVIHKDLKPANLFLIHPDQDREDLRVLDFGVARLSEGAANTLTGTGQVFGTTRYLAPEYIRDNKQISPALDVYQMGLILVELLTGRPTVWAENPLAIAAKHLENDLDIPPALLASPLGPALRRATAPNPRERFPDAGAFHKALLAVDPASIPWPLTASAAAPDAQTELMTHAGAPPDAPTQLQLGPHDEPWRFDAPTLTPSPTHAPPAPRAASPRGWLLAGGAALLLLAALALLWAIQPGAKAPSPTPSPRPAAEPPAPDSAEPPAPAEPAPVEIPQPVEPAPAAAPAAPASAASLVVHTAPEGAHISLIAQKKFVGKAPVEIPWEPGQASLDVLVARLGFKTERVTLHRKDGDEQTITLTPKK
jgi:serine/threonine protein kinase